MELFGIHFAPLRVPLKRRLQTLAAAAWIFVLGFGGVIGWLSTIYFLLFTTWMRYFSIFYLMWIYYDKDTCIRGGRALWWYYYRDYFPIKLHKTVDLEPSKNYLFCAYPHGILASGAFAAFATNILEFEKLFPGLESKMLTLTQHFMVPFFREFAYCCGACSSSAESIENLLSYKTTSPEDFNNAVILIVGGAAEALNCKPSTYRIIYNKRKGFIRMALKTGAPLVPVFSFGETDIYDQVNAKENSFLHNFQQTMKNYTGLIPVIVKGRGLFQYTFGIVPYRRPINVVVGAPLNIPKITEPSNEEIDKYHGLFKEKLLELFETQKYNYLSNPKDINLILE
ncbi:Similar to mogat2-a: 2-acylglycerol O-acyltransferase 2-A (Xenopus laevis) [Cotesia congregata]|uniref:Acyltransferase n=1 Tax=Cotesia congregata TaxID=51543 RepID=A0A8J2HLT0_COTCN|nr:Similar to mogat2-a: 2-acylglycerol O-acyltransferase 2-A (Xenopus laevis) [Cotesia congregata]